MNISAKKIILQVVALTVIWSLFAGWSILAWIVGTAVIITTLLVSMVLPRPIAFKIHPIGAARFLIYFIKQSVLGGIDVAWRALHPRCPLSPGLIQYELRLANDFAILVFANTVSLLPGTLSVDLNGNQATIHALDVNHDIKRELNLLEQSVGKLFGEEMTND